jgi:hypothetical protein
LKTTLDTSTNGTPVTTGGPDQRWLVHADGQRLRISPQASYYYGPFGFLGEYGSESQDVSIGADIKTKTVLIQ